MGIDLSDIIDIESTEYSTQTFITYGDDSIRKLMPEAIF
jgi:hypothetical protein